MAHQTHAKQFSQSCANYANGLDSTYVSLTCTTSKRSTAMWAILADCMKY